jgi:hypothetical protein
MRCFVSMGSAIAQGECAVAILCCHLSDVSGFSPAMAGAHALQRVSMSDPIGKQQVPHLSQGGHLTVA